MKITYIRPTGTFPQTPAAVQGVVAAVISPTEIDLTWTAISGAQNYTVRISGNPVMNTPSPAVQFAQLSPSTTYLFTVSAINTFGEGPQSAPVSATTQPAVVPPGAVTGLTALAVGSAEIDLSWTTVPNTTNYAITRGGASIAAPTGTNYADKNLAASTPYNYTVTATNSAGGGPPASISATTGPITGGVNPGATKFRPGHGVWYENTDWRLSGSAQKTSFDASIAALGADPIGPRHICIYLRWSALEDAAGGTYAVAKANIDYILTKCKSQPFPMYLTIRGIVRTFGGNLNTDTTFWPQYAINQSDSNPAHQGGPGWIVNCQVTGSNQVNSQLNFGNAAAVAAYTKAWQFVADTYNADPNVEILCPHDESIYVNGPGATNGISPTTFFNAFKQMHLDIKAHAPNTWVQCAVNFINTDPATNFTATQQFQDLYTSLPAAYPGGFIFGGPDPGTRGTSAQVQWRGGSGTQGDLRGKLAWADMVQGPPLSTNADSPAQVAASAINGGPILGATWPTNLHAWYMFWVYESNYPYKWDPDQIAVVHAMNGLTNPGTPSVGIFDSTPGQHG